jgi:tetratricopeptide (TPR) repeat protein
VLVLFLCCKAIVTGGIIEGPAMVQSYENIFGTMSFGERSPGAFGALAYLLVKTFLPLGLSPDYSAESLPVELGWRWPLSVAGVCAGIGLLLYCRANLRRGGRGWALALAGVASYCLVSNLFFTIGVTLALRLVYLPLTAVGLGAGWAWARWRDSALARRRLRSGLAPLPDLVLAATVALLLAATWNFAPAWRTEADYARRTLAQFPRSWRANQNLAALLYVERDFEAGLQHARTALILRPEEAVSWDTLGVNATFVPGHEAEAEAALRKAIELNPLLSLPYKHLRYLFSRSNRSGECSPF